MISVDAGSGVDCGCWWLVVQLWKWKVNELMTFEVTWQKFRASLEGLTSYIQMRVPMI